MASAFEPGDHGSTFGGNPLACAAGLAVMEVMINDKLVKNSEEMGSYFLDKLSGFTKKYDFVKEIRGKGLMIGIQLTIDKAAEIKNKCFDKGYLIGSVGNNILRLLPPLIVTKEDIDGLVNVLDNIFREY